MSTHVPIMLMAFIRPDLIKKCMRQLAKFEPPILYVMGDGPRDLNEEKLCNESRCIASNPSWDCEVIKIYNSSNKGIVKSFCTGMNAMFKEHEFGIYLEDDILLSSSFYNFAKDLLIKYRHNNNVGHINATNMSPDYIPPNNESYIFSNHVAEWGFATWKRMWDSYDVKMLEWANVDQNQILKKTSTNFRAKKSLKKMFDIHYDNDSPLAWGYQWHFNCLLHNALTITPTLNMSLNIGFERNDSTNTFGINPIAHDLEETAFPLTHPRTIKQNLRFDKLVENKLCPSHINIIKGKLKNKINSFYSRIKD